MNIVNWSAGEVEIREKRRLGEWMTSFKALDVVFNSGIYQTAYNMYKMYIELC